MVPYNLKHKNLENFEAKAYATLTSYIGSLFNFDFSL